MKRITFRADAKLIEKARVLARFQQRTLNEAFREWLEIYTERNEAVRAYKDLMSRLRHIDACGPYTRDKMNER